jgi:hypothetical protein
VFVIKLIGPTQFEGGSIWDQSSKADDLQDLVGELWKFVRLFKVLSHVDRCSVRSLTSSMLASFFRKRSKTKKERYRLQSQIEARHASTRIQRRETRGTFKDIDR